MTKQIKEQDAIKQSVNNLALWDRVKTTDRQFTKEVGYGGYKYTAIHPQYQIYLATKEWGPMGMSWGLKELDFDLIRDGKGEPIELAGEAVFFFPEGSFPIASDIRYKAGDNCRKKLRTDMLTKALSQLGFNADIFLDGKNPNWETPPPPTSKSRGEGRRKSRMKASMVKQYKERIQTELQNDQAAAQETLDKIFDFFELTEEQTQIFTQLKSYLK